MVIKFNCPHCKRGLSVKDHLAGKKAGCPACKKVLVIPGSASAAISGPTAADVERAAAAALADAPEESAARAAQTIDFPCPQCGEPVSFPADLAGKQSPCPECRRIIKIPVPKVKDPRDWRKVDTSIPTAARRDNEPAPEGAWGSSTARAVSGEALQEAGVIPVRRVKLTLQQKITRYILAGTAVVVISVVGLMAVSFLRQNKQDRLVARAVEMASADEAKAPTSAAEINRAAGLYFLHSGKRDSAPEAQTKFNKARELLVNSPAGTERDLLLVDLALAQAELGGTGVDVDQGKRLKWEAALKDLRQTLPRITSSGGRLHALRLLAHQLSEDQTVGVAGLLAAPEERQEAAKDLWYLSYERPELLAATGLELAAGGHTSQASQLLKLRHGLVHLSSRRPGCAPAGVRAFHRDPVYRAKREAAHRGKGRRRSQ